jgi:hypothetical protein
MEEMAEALRPMTLDSRVPQPDSNAPEKPQRVAHFAALSRRCPIQDAQDYWSTLEEQAQEEIAIGKSGFVPAQSVMHRSSADTAGATSPSDPIGTDLAPRLGSTDTCVAQGNPSYT